MVVSTKLSGFGAHLNSCNQLNLNQRDLIRGVMTVGRKNFPNVFKGGSSRVIEICGLALQIMSYTSVTQDHLVASQLYQDLEASEKATVSYRIGMALAKLVAEKTIGVPWLQHVAPLIKAGIVNLHSGSKRQGDLIGQDTLGQWHVVEAKGRANTPSRSVFVEAKHQASRVSSINGLKPATRCASVADLSGPFFVDFSDPVEYSAEYEPVRLDVDDILFLREYYALFTDLAREQQSFSRTISTTQNAEIDFELVQLPLTGIMVGLRKELTPFLGIEDKSYDRWIQLCREWVTSTPQVPNGAIGADGIIVLEER